MFSLICSFEDEYQILQQIGSGSFAEVFKVKEKSNKPQIKASKRILLNQFDKFEEPERLKEFRSDHIIEYERSIRDGNQLYIVMHMSKGSLRDLIKKKFQFSEKALIRLIMQITSAMLLLDEKHVMHLDLKPENILFENQDYFKICDFGCAKIFQGLSKIGCFDELNFGTPKYISPEIAAGMIETKKSSQDVWSLGVIIYQLMYRKFPFHIDEETGKYDRKEIHKFCQGKWQIKYLKNEKLPIDLVKRMLHYDPIDRITWKGIKKYLIEKYDVEEIEFCDIGKAYEDYIAGQLLIMSLIQFIKSNLSGNNSHQFWMKFEKDIKKIKNLLVICNSLHAQKFEKLFGYKFVKLNNRNEKNDKIKQFQLFYETVKHEEYDYCKINKVKPAKLQSLKERQAQLFKLCESMLKQLKKSQAEWKTLKLLRVFCEEMKEIKAKEGTLFCQFKYLQRTNQVLKQFQI